MNGPLNSVMNAALESFMLHIKALECIMNQCSKWSSELPDTLGSSASASPELLKDMTRDLWRLREECSKIISDWCNRTAYMQQWNLCPEQTDRVLIIGQTYGITTKYSLLQFQISAFMSVTHNSKEFDKIRGNSP